MWFNYQSSLVCKPLTLMQVRNLQWLHHTWFWPVSMHCMDFVIHLFHTKQYFCLNGCCRTDWFTRQQIDLHHKRLFLTFWCLAAFRDFREKNTETHMALPRNFSSQKLKRRGKSFSLHSKKIFWLGVEYFCEWHHKWKTFRPPWPTSPGPGLKTLDGSILLKFLFVN